MAECAELIDQVAERGAPLATAGLSLFRWHAQRRSNAFLTTWGLSLLSLPRVELTPLGGAPGRAERGFRSLTLHSAGEETGLGGDSGPVSLPKGGRLVCRPPLPVPGTRRVRLQDLRTVKANPVLSADRQKGGSPAGDGGAFSLTRQNARIRDAVTLYPVHKSFQNNRGINH